jgi:hypothetical protein
LSRPEKLDHPVSYSRLSDFGSFLNRNRTRATLEYLKVQDILRHGKGLKGNKEPIWRKSKAEAKVAKTRLSSFGYWSVWCS